jgi:hypothetical protein
VTWEEVDRLTQLADRLPHDDGGALQRQRRHDGCDHDVGPAGAEHAGRREQDREIAELPQARSHCFK